MAETGSGSAALLERVLVGDEGAMAVLIDAAWPRLGRARLHLDRAELRQEAATELLAAAVEHRARPTGDFTQMAVARLKRRLAAVVRAERTRSARIRPLDPTDEERAGREPATRFAEQIESPALAGALARLSPRERAVIARVYWREMTAAEIAERDGVDADSVRRIRRQAEAALRQALGGRRPGRR